MWLMEQPVTIVFGGVVLVAVLLGGLMQTGRHGLLYAAFGSILLTVTLFLVERSVITPREEVKATLQVIVNDLEQNDVAKIVEHVSRGLPDLRRQAETKLARIEIIDVDIKRNLRIEVVAQRGMEIAVAEFNAVIRFRLRRDSMEQRPFPQYFTVRFRKEDDGKWRIRSYEMTDPRVGIGS